MTFVPSAEQQAIFDAVLKENVQALAISALAGTGKTTTLVELARRLPAAGSKLFCAFNKDIVTELSTRLDGTGMEAKTFHGIGYSALRQYLGVRGGMQIEKQKYSTLVHEFMNDDPVLQPFVTQMTMTLPTFRDALKDAERLTTQLLKWVMKKLIDWHDANAIAELIRTYRLDTDLDLFRDESPDLDAAITNLIQLLVKAVPALMSRAETLTRESRIIDFDDQIYWVVRWHAPVYSHDWVFVDECQDLNPMQREMISRCVRKVGGRIVLVGDAHQAIYEFAGADGDSFNLSVAKFDARILPLNLTRRCAKIITRHAAQIVHSFVCPDDKPDGQIIWIEDEAFSTHVTPGDMVLCRMRAPLVAACLKLISAGVPATILGGEIGEKLMRILKTLAKRKGFTFTNVEQELNKYQDEQVARALGKNDEDLAASIADECDAVRSLIKLINPISMDTLMNKLQGLFSEGGTTGKVVLSTIHKSKGMEADRVFILAPDRLPLIFGGRNGKPSKQRPESIAQEHNLDYVARTRAKSTLVYVVNDAYRKKMTPKPLYVQDGWPRPIEPAAAELAQPSVIVPKTNSPTGEFPAPVVIENPRAKLLAIVDALNIPEIDLLISVLQQARNAKSDKEARDAAAS